MKCSRCGGLLVQADEVFAYRCINCGERYRPMNDEQPSIYDKLSPEERGQILKALPPTTTASRPQYDMPPQSQWDIPDISIRCVARHGKGHCRGIQVAGTLYCPLHQRKYRQPKPKTEPPTVKPPQPPKVKPMPNVEMIPSEISFKVGRTVEDWKKFVDVWATSYATYKIETVDHSGVSEMTVSMGPFET